MELGHSRHGSDAFAAQLRQLVSVCGVDIDKAIHVTDAEAMDGVGRVELPLGPETACRQLFNMRVGSEKVLTWSPICPSGCCVE